MSSASQAGALRFEHPAGLWQAWRRHALQLLLVVGAAAHEMSIVEHLEELRRRLLWSLAFIAATSVVCWIFAADLYEVASAPIRSNPAVTMTLSRAQDIFALYTKVTLVTAIFISSPLVLAQAWLFISPGLHPHERRWAVPFVLSASVLFVAGGVFGYYIAFPKALAFLLDWMLASGIKPNIDAADYFDLFFTIMVTLGIVFQIPAVIFVLSRIGLVTARILVRYLKHAVLACVTVAAIVTPTTDFANMLIIAAPMIVLYALGIVVAWVFGKPRRAEAA